MKVIEVNNLVKKYGNLTAVDNISFSVNQGCICGILGPNGSGKTTTIKSICNLIIPDKGSIKIFGKNNTKSMNRLSAIFDGTRNLYWRLTPKENLRYFAGIRGLGGKKIENKIDELLDQFNLTDKKNTMVNELSRGMRQKVAIAMALICDTDIILLDEPTLGLDVQSYMDIKNILLDITTNMNKTILLSTHAMDLVEEVCDDVVILNQGKIVVNDSVGNLMSMVKRKTYEVNLLHTLSDENIEYIINSHLGCYVMEDKSSIEVDIIDSKEIYNLIDVLKQQNIFIKEIKQKEINFQRLYLNFTQ